MRDRSIQQVIEFNQEVAALSSAGVLLEFGDTLSHPASRGRAVSLDRVSPDGVAAMLDQAGMALTTRVGRGQSLEQAVLEEPSLSSNYRRALLTLLRCDDPRLALETLAAPSRTQHRFVDGLSSAFVYPLIVLGIAYCGFIYFCLVTGPAIEGMYLQLGEESNPVVQFLSSARNSMPVWGPLIPLLTALFLLWWYSRGRKLAWNWLPGGKQYYRDVRHAQVAKQLAGMVESGATLDVALATVFADSVPDAARTDTRLRADSVPHDAPAHSTSIDSRLLGRLPPLLRWAIEADPDEEPPGKTLRYVATTYEQTVLRRERNWRSLTPALCGLAIGGLIVLGYGLSLFVPIVRLLQDVATMGSGLGGG